MAGRDAIGEEAADLVVEDRAGAVVPESVGGISGGLMDFVRREEGGKNGLLFVGGRLGDEMNRTYRVL